MSVKVDVEFQVGETVTFISMIGCRGQEKTIASIDEIRDRIHFTDGTSYHHLDPDCEGMTLLWSRARPKVLIPDTAEPNVFQAAGRLEEWFTGVPEVLNVVARHDYGDEEHLLVSYRKGSPPARVPDTFDGFPVVYEARSPVSPQIIELIRWRSDMVDDYGDDLLIKVYHRLLEQQMPPVPEEHQAAFTELKAMDNAYNVIKDALIEIGHY